MVLLLAGCNRSGNLQNAEAVRKGVLNHLSSNSSLDVNSMDVEVASVSFREGEADAVISFRPKGSTDPANSMQMRYTLERKGGQWQVKGKAEASGGAHGGASPHGGDSALPPGHPLIEEPTGPAK